MNKGLRTYTVDLKLEDDNGEMDGEYLVVVRAKNPIGARYAAILEVRRHALDLGDVDPMPEELRFVCRAVYTGALKNLWKE